MIKEEVEGKWEVIIEGDRRGYGGLIGAVYVLDIKGGEGEVGRFGEFNFVFVVY